MDFNTKLLSIYKYLEIDDDVSMSDVANLISLDYSILGSTESIINQFWNKKKHLIPIIEIEIQEVKSKKRKKSKKKKKRTKFYIDPKWQFVRREIIKLYGTKCMCCGNTPKESINVHIDHIKPKSKYPKLRYDYNNLQVLCNVCNTEKSNIRCTDYRTEEDKLKLELLIRK